MRGDHLIPAGGALLGLQDFSLQNKRGGERERENYLRNLVEDYNTWGVWCVVVILFPLWAFSSGQIYGITYQLVTGYFGYIKPKPCCTTPARLNYIHGTLYTPRLTTHDQCVFTTETGSRLRNRSIRYTWRLSSASSFFFRVLLAYYIPTTYLGIYIYIYTHIYTYIHTCFSFSSLTSDIRS